MFSIMGPKTYSNYSGPYSSKLARPMSSRPLINMLSYVPRPSSKMFKPFLLLVEGVII